MDRPVNRRRLVQGAAWATPVIVASAAAPAFAASPGCAGGPVDVDFSQGTRTVLSSGASGMPESVQWSYQDAETGVTVTITTTAIGDTILGGRTSYATDEYVDTDLTADSTGGLNIQQVTRSGSAPGTGGEGQDVTISFSRQGSSIAVSDLSLTVDDIDSRSGNWTDGVALISGPVLGSPGRDLDGNGTAGPNGTYTSGPWHNYSSSSGSNDPTDRLQISGATVDSFTLRYTNLPRVNGSPAAGVNADQNIQLSQLRFTAPEC